MDFCMPKLITDAAETTINALIYATEHTPDVFHEVLTVLDKLADYAKELLSKNLLLFQRGNVSLLEMKKVSAKKGMRGLEESFMCSNKSALGRNYALMLRLQGKWGLQTGGIGAKMAIKKSKAVGAGIYFGCQKLKFKVTPFWSMRWLSKGIAFPFKEKDTDEDKFGADIQFKWYHSEFPCFPPDLLRCAKLEPLEALEKCLEARHLAPTAPDTLPTQPFEETDPFVIDAVPHVLFSGGHDKFASKWHSSGQGGTQCICVPAFWKHPAIVLVNLRDPKDLRLEEFASK
ncbi:DNA polymerase delta subunit 2 (Pol31 polymerase delta subunit) [Durusdinium trenchii]|uniref:DNA polymerase delta subunit 2 (Pol31 polymerase delta subunit) n=2 Tax=Durusdinium trenchii TaxID=1381693 RepID=A0ABP0SQG2_9DINO